MVRLLRNIGMLATCRPEGAQEEVHAIAGAAVVWEGATISWVGLEGDLPEEFRHAEAWDARGRLVVPGLVDCHTHLAFGGWRAGEFEQRARGVSYLEIAKAGGGIASTVAATRAMSEEDLLLRCREFLREMARLGVTTVEAKSGYGLERDTELRLLRVYRRLGEEPHHPRIVPTFLGAHVVPAEYRDRRSDYVDLLVAELIPEIAREGLAKYCDVFVEETAFTVPEARRVLQAAAAEGMGAKLHADQLAAGGGAELAGEVGAASADHLEHISDRGIDALRAAGTVAVSLPLASLYLRQPPMPARRLIEAGVPVGVATDFNPGSAPTYHLPLAMTLAVTMQHMTPAEALRGATSVAARAIGLEGEAGSVTAGAAADFVLVDAPDVNHWLYHFRPNACLLTVAGGRVVWESPGLSVR